jgi:hypothetical protein
VKCTDNVHDCRDAPNTVVAGYPANPKAGYRISGRIIGLTCTGIFLVKYQINLYKAITIIDFCKPYTKHDLVPVTTVDNFSAKFFFLALVEEKLNKLLDQLNNRRIPCRIFCIWPCPISGRAILYPAGPRI